MNWTHTERSDKSNYDFSFDGKSVSLASKKQVEGNSIGAIKQSAVAQQAHGRIVKFEGEIATENTDGAGLFITASTQTGHVSDSMHDRLIKGTIDWQTIKLVIRVPEDTMYLSYGIWMTNRGKVMLRNEKFEILQEDQEKDETLTNSDFYKWTGGNTWKKEPPVPA